LISSETLLNLPGYQITATEDLGGEVRISARYSGPISCPHCFGTQLRNKDAFLRQVRHTDMTGRRCVLALEGHKWQCLGCSRYFRQRFPGILKCQRSSEAYRKRIFDLHLAGINRSRLGRRERIGAATVERHFRHGLGKQIGERHSRCCPRVLGIDEHFFTRRKGYATTLCDLRKRKVYDVVLGRSEQALEAYLARLEGKNKVRVVSMDLSSCYRALVRKHFPNARIVADRFHVIRLINHHFLACWRDLDPVASKNRGLVSLMRRHRHNLKPEQKTKLRHYLATQPALAVIYHFKQHLCYLLLRKNRTRKQCEKLAPRLLKAVDQLRQAGLAQLVQLGQTLESWQEEIATMWRFTRNNGITEGFHNKMELISRQAYGFRNFENYRLRVKVLCS
jgi:transposase